MKRREFIRNSTIASVGMTGMGGCATVGGWQSLKERMDSLDMDSHFATIDETVKRIGDFRYSPSGPLDRSDELGRAAARSLGISSAFRDLPLEAQLHPGMQTRISGAMDEMDQTVFTNSRQIITSGIASDTDIIKAIKKSDNQALRFLEQFDRDAQSCGVSRRKRFRLRSIGTDTIDRMRH